ncbi:hypothetical protein JOM56_015243 [Amanita muscaria]
MSTVISTSTTIRLYENVRCSRFRILVIGRANAGKTTILEKVCNVKEGMKPIVYDKDVVTPTFQRGEHEIEHQITYPGCNFIFHDSRGFENQLHAIWYCIPMDTCRPYLPAEREFFDQGTGKVPLVVIFTKFEALVTQECCKLDDILEDEEAKWIGARVNAERTFQDHYLKPIMSTKYPPKALKLMAQENANFSQLIEKTAHAISIGSLRQLFTATQMNSLNICIKEALEFKLCTSRQLEVLFYWIHDWYQLTSLVCECRNESHVKRKKILQFVSSASRSF